MQGWKRSGLTDTVELEPLDPEMVGQMVEAIFDDPTQPDTRNFLHARCEGNPFVLEELLKEALDRGDIYRTEGGWERKALSESRLPDTVRDAILLHLERMTESQVTLVRAAAVLGQAFEDRTLLALLGEERETALEEMGQAADAARARLHLSYVLRYGRHRGVVDKFARDAAMATFNVSGASVDHAEHALRAAVALRDRARYLGLPLGIGIATGPAIVRRTTEAANLSVLGETTNLASRLQARAAPGEILLSDESWRRLRHQTEAKPVELELKGFQSLVTAYRVPAR